MKTNAARLLDTLGVAYELREYDPGEEHLPAEEVAVRFVPQGVGPATSGHELNVESTHGSFALVELAGAGMRSVGHGASDARRPT